MVLEAISRKKLVLNFSAKVLAKFACIIVNVVLIIVITKTLRPLLWSQRIDWQIHSVNDKHVSFEYLQTLFVVEMPFVVIPNIF